tara:strand:+ start:834 stop:938 length:105 start_codon:yes stop_codon:yes gene_type:complete
MAQVYQPLYHNFEQKDGEYKLLDEKFALEENNVC